MSSSLTRLFFTLLGALALLGAGALGAGLAAFALISALEPPYRVPAAALAGVALLLLAALGAWTLRARLERALLAIAGAALADPLVSLIRQLK